MEIVYKSLVDNLDSAIIVLDQDLRIQASNKSAQKLFSHDNDSLLGTLITEIINESHIDASGRFGEPPEGYIPLSFIDGITGRTLPINKSRTDYLSMKQKQNSESPSKFLQITSKAIAMGNDYALLVILDDMSYWMECKLQLKDQANQDFLTGLANRRHFFDIGLRYFLTAQRAFINIAIAMIDIDFFKRINDSYGHSFGDKVIQEVAGVLKVSLRKNDLISRFGREEFCVLLQCADGHDALSVMEKVRSTVENHSISHGETVIGVTISIGISSEIENVLDTMINKADEMLYQAKHNGRNRIEINT